MLPPRRRHCRRHATLILRRRFAASFRCFIAFAAATQAISWRHIFFA